ncbi:FlaG/FlaF family flagellin (archaellin) [Methanomicrobium sp. W14]|jgi:FlaG/FlaF family flagellin (archaellin)|uniref:type IV pilin n=1 Tax=Methanomicrobium sp. W14 TaxID=2817839 RepID=UPI001AE0ED4D|nr:type IV pilin N-terminal domain-containing protein [Methanomicrobium sp. W14]MBP2133468.1 FlaG/FlaF family flagellin (archaellin) [Methanomicrobium sp. W14]
MDFDAEENCEALSPVVGEMMMVALAILLVSLFSVTLLGLLPSERSDTVDIRMNYSIQDNTITLWHKGGDWIKKSEIRVIVIQGEGKDTHTYTIKPSDEGFSMKGESFDLGDNITVDVYKTSSITLKGGETVRLVSGKNTIYSGETSLQA